MLTKSSGKSPFSKYLRLQSSALANGGTNLWNNMMKEKCWLRWSQNVCGFNMSLPHRKIRHGEQWPYTDCFLQCRLALQEQHRIGLHSHTTFELLSVSVYMWSVTGLRMYSDSITVSGRLAGGVLGKEVLELLLQSLALEATET